MECSQDKKTLALTVTAGIGEFGQQVIKAIDSFHSVLPDVLKSAWQLFPVDPTQSADSFSDAMDGARAVLLNRKNTAYILDSGYEIEGRRGQTEIRIRNIYIWSSDDYGSTIPESVLESIESRPGDSHIGFCYESEAKPVNLEKLHVPPAFAHHIVENTLHSGEIIEQDGLVSSLAGVILTGFLPNTEFDMAKNIGAVSSVGFSGKFGLIWSSKRHMANLLVDRVLRHHLSLPQEEVERLGLPPEMEALADKLDPHRMGLSLFDAETAGVLMSQRIPVRPSWSSGNLDVDMNDEELSCDLHTHEKPDWPNQIRIYARAFSMSLLWKWKMIIGKAVGNIQERVLTTLLPFVEQCLDTMSYGPSYCEFMLKRIRSKTDEERRTRAIGTVGFTQNLSDLKKSIASLPDLPALAARTLIWLGPAIYLLIRFAGTAYSSETGGTLKATLIGALSCLIVLVLAGVYVYRKMKTSEERLYTARDASIHSLAVVEAGVLSANAAAELGNLVSELRTVIESCNQRINSYRMNLNTALMKNSEILEKVSTDRYAVLSPVLRDIDEYEHLLETNMRVKFELLLDRIVSDTDILKGQFFQDSHSEEIQKKLSDKFMDYLDDRKLILELPGLKAIISSISSLGKRKINSLSVVSDMIRDTVPMTSRDDLGQEEFILGVPEDMLERVEKDIQELKGVTEPEVVDMGDFQFLFCISRAVLETGRGVGR